MQEMRVKFDPDDPAVLIGTDLRQEANPARQIAANLELDGLEAYHKKARTHLWLVLLTHKANDQMLNARDGQLREDPDAGLPLLDLDTLVGMPAMLCYICEAAYEPRLRHRKCPGEPQPMTG